MNQMSTPIEGRDTNGATTTMHRYADIALHMAGTEVDTPALAAALDLAARFDAHVETLLTNYVPLPPATAGLGMEAVASEIRQRGKEAGETLEGKVKTELAAKRIETELRRVDGILVDFTEAVARLARITDLFVVSQPRRDDPVGTTVLEAVLFDAGASAFVVPEETESLGTLDTILIAWRDTPECARAIAAALPLLQRADKVVLTSVAENGSDEERHREPAAEAARHLARHGVNVEVRHVAKWRHPAEGLINEAQIVGAGLIVAGAYGHSRLREMILGGVTRELLQTCRLPLLMAH